MGLHASAILPRQSPPPEWATAWCPRHGWRNQDGWSESRGLPECNQTVRKEQGIPILCASEVQPIEIDGGATIRPVPPIGFEHVGGTCEFCERGERHRTCVLTGGRMVPVQEID